MVDLPEIIVVAGIIRDAGGQLCLSRRPAHKHQGGLWEFPGGKVEEGETLHHALARELSEELGMDAARSEPFMTVRHRYPDLRVTLHFRDVLDYRGEPHGREGQPVEWVPLAELSGRALPAANRPVAAALKLPRQLVIPPPEQTEQRLRQGIDALDPATQGLYLRQWSDHPALADIAEHCHRRGLRFWLRDHADLAAQTQAFGLHLTGGVTGGSELARERPQSGRQDPRALDLPNFPGILSTACHNEAEIAHALEIGAHMALVSPVNATPTHPDAKPLGWDGFADLIHEKPLVMYALGGVGPADLAAARQHGAFGVAGIRAFWPPTDRG